ncbi:MAG: discoidin domain-containing protein [Clostridia bacterium]|nr:discoidin domain-containing protein [Clostridia bacterium]
MKKVLSILVVICVMLSCMSTAFAADYSLAINNNVALMVGSSNAVAWNSIVQTVAPVEENGIMLAPVGFVTAGFNGSVEEFNGITVVKLGDRVAVMKEGNKNVVVDGRVYYPEIAPKKVNGTLMLPVEFLGETVLGKHVYYDAATKLAVISHRKCLSSRDRDVISTISGAITSGSLPEIAIKAPVITEVGGAMGGMNAETGQLKFVSVYADQEPEPENNGMCMIDGNTGSRWASQGAASATLDLGAVKPVTHVRVAVWKPNERSTNYSIEVSADGRNYKKVADGGSSGATYDSYDVNDSIRYVRINTNGTSVGDWASILELEAWNGTAVVNTTTPGVAGSVVVAPSGTKVTLTSSMLTASQTPEAENHAGNLVDGNKMTVWASQGDASVTINLGSAKTVSTVGVAMKMYEDNRTIPYDIEISSNGTSYTQVWTGSSDEMTDTTKYVSVGSGAQYVRITAHGNTISGWNSIAEIEVYSSGAATGGTTTTTTTTTTAGTGSVVASATGTKVTLSTSMLTASQTPEAENHAGNLIDGNKMTVWASQNEANVVIDLGSAKTLSCIGVAMKMYEDTRTIPYKIEVSADGVSYSEVWSGDSEQMTDTTKYVSTSASARYIRVTAYGNTVSGWNSIAEIEVYSK